jgi:hypothetical protein
MLRHNLTALGAGLRLSITRWHGQCAENHPDAHDEAQANGKKDKQSKRRHVRPSTRRLGYRENSLTAYKIRRPDFEGEDCLIQAIGR